MAEKLERSLSKKMPKTKGNMEKEFPEFEMMKSRSMFASITRGFFSGSELLQLNLAQAQNMNFDGITVASLIIKDIADSIVDKEYDEYIQ